jgi:hypothetical protein
VYGGKAVLAHPKSSQSYNFYCQPDALLAQRFSPSIVTPSWPTFNFISAPQEQIAEKLIGRGIGNLDAFLVFYNKITSKQKFFGSKNLKSKMKQGETVVKQVKIYYVTGCQKQKNRLERISNCIAKKIFKRAKGQSKRQVFFCKKAYFSKSRY